MITEDIQKALTEVRPLPITYATDDLDFLPEDTNRYELTGGNLIVSRAPLLPEFSLKLADTLRF